MVVVVRAVAAFVEQRDARWSLIERLKDQASHSKEGAR